MKTMKIVGCIVCVISICIAYKLGTIATDTDRIVKQTTTVEEEGTYISSYEGDTTPILVTPELLSESIVSESIVKRQVGEYVEEQSIKTFIFDKDLTLSNIQNKIDSGDK